MFDFGLFVLLFFSFFFFYYSTPSEIYTLSLHDALPICRVTPVWFRRVGPERSLAAAVLERRAGWRDRKSTRLNSSHLGISYAVFCLKKKKNRIAVSTSYFTYSNVARDVNTDLT